MVVEGSGRLPFRRRLAAWDKDAKQMNRIFEPSIGVVGRCFKPGKSARCGFAGGIPMKQKTAPLYEIRIRVHPFGRCGKSMN